MRAHVDQAVRRVVHGVHEARARRRRAPAPHARRDVGDGAERVGGGADGDQPGPRGRAPLEAVPVELARLRRSIGTHAHASRPRSRASACQGATLAWWSSSVTTISSPGPQPRPSARARWKVSVVMLAPKAISSGSAPRKSARAPARAGRASRRSRDWSGRRQWVLALWCRDSRSIASTTARGTCVPPGPSK